MRSRIRAGASAAVALAALLGLGGCTNPLAVFFFAPTSRTAPTQPHSSATAAKSDAAYIGTAVASYFVDVDGPLTVQLATGSGTGAYGGTYHPGDWILVDPHGEVQDSGPLQDGDVLGTSHIQDWDAWCVSVGTHSGDFWSYTQDGLNHGKC